MCICKFSSPTAAFYWKKKPQTMRLFRWENRQVCPHTSILVSSNNLWLDLTSPLNRQIITWTKRCDCFFTKRKERNLWFRARKKALMSSKGFVIASYSHNLYSSWCNNSQEVWALSPFVTRANPSLGSHQNCAKGPSYLTHEPCQVHVSKVPF